MLSPTDGWLRQQHQELWDTEHQRKAWAVVDAWANSSCNSFNSSFVKKKKSNTDKIHFLLQSSFCANITYCFGFCLFVSMMGPRPRAPCMLGKCSIKGAAPSPQPMCICFEGWRMNIQCLLRWKMKVGNISDFFALGNYDFGTWDIHGVLQKILLSCSGSVLQADVNRKFTPSTSEGFTQALGIQDTPSAQVSPLQAPLHRLQRELGEGVTLQAQWPSEIKHLDFGTSSAWSTPGLCCPSMGTTEEKTLGIDERKKSLIRMNGIFLWKWLQNASFKSSNHIFQETPL